MSVSEGTQSSSTARFDLIGGLVLATFGVITLAISFYHPGPLGFFGPVLWARGFALFIALGGLGAAFGFVPVRNPQDFYGGMALIGLGVVALLASIDLPGMRGFAFGPGTAPRLFAIMLASLSAVLVILGVLTKGPAIERYTWRGPVFVIGAILCFAATIRPLGLVIAAFATIVVSAGAAPDVKYRETIIWGVILTAFCSVLFPYGLNLPFQLWPRFW
jgi:putative tricarboxylic transport membrane protein